MYKVMDSETRAVIEIAEITLVKQQEKIDFPIGCLTLDEADGVVLSDGETTLGIDGRNMQNYTPTVIVEKLSEEYAMILDLHKYQVEPSVLTSELDAAYREGVNSYAE